MIHSGRCISPGVASGRAHVLEADSSLATASALPAHLPRREEIERLRAAVARAVAQLDRLRRQMGRRISSQDAAIFTAHATMLTDGSLLDRLARRIEGQQLSAEAAVAQVVTELHADFAASDHPVFRDRAADILDIGRRLVDCLVEADARTTRPGSVIVAPDVTPSDFVKFVHQGAVAFVTETCGNKSHTAILARGLGVPLVTGLVGVVDRISEGAEVAVDAASGTVVVDPTPDERAAVALMLSKVVAVPKGIVPAQGAASLDGLHVTVLLNISDPIEAGAVATLGAEGVGLFRTEFLYIDRPTWPTEDESYTDYLRVAEALGNDRELNIRLADFGAEKSPPYADIPVNRNPSLGIRGIRLLLQRDDILQPQVLAIARLASRRPVTLLFPMIDTLDTLDATIDRLCAICGAATRELLPFKLGTMIEVPSAGLMIDDILDRVDSAAIGLNDLTQYVLAADRDDELVERYHDALQPPVLRLVKMILDAAERKGRHVTMCGELAGDPTLAAVLLGLGARRFSVSRTHYPTAVATFGRLNVGELTAAAAGFLKLRSGAEIRRFMAERFPQTVAPTP